MYSKRILSNGLRIVYEKIPYVRSVSIGIWVGTGSRNEKPDNRGISHFIEHMLFKGTSRRTAKQIAEEMDGIGGQLNAFTGKECTCYYAKTLDSHVDVAFDVLSDMFFNSRFSPKDIEIEKKVILEEIGMYEDSPEELVHDVLSGVIWRGDSLGCPILGTRACLREINGNMIREYMMENYMPRNTVISVAGNFDDERIYELVEKHFGMWRNRTCGTSGYDSVVFNSDLEFKPKDTEQVHICIGFDGIEYGDDRLYALMIVNNIFGGGMSSRLFQKIREEKGLVYSVYSYPSSYKGAGSFVIYMGMSPEFIESVVQLFTCEMGLLAGEGLSEDEIRKGKEQLKGSYILGLESTNSRMTSIGKSELLLGRILSPETVLEKIERVTREDIAEVMGKVFYSKRMAVAMVGNVKDPRSYFSGLIV